MSDKAPSPLNDAEVTRKLAEYGLCHWKLEDGWLRRKFTTDGWRSTLMLVNAIGFLAEAGDHHPDLAVTWGKVWVKLKTHSAGAITERDFALAKLIEQHVQWRPQPGEALAGAAADEFVKIG